MHPVPVKRIPARPLGLNPLAIAFKVSLAGSRIEDVMFARNVEGVETGLNFVGVVELLRLGHMTDIARMGS
jgi:hypothetical protein